jgi:hypothetical protein
MLLRERERAIMNEFITPYQASKIVNRLIKVGKPVPTQMLYNYVSHNLIKTEVIDGRKMIKTEVAIAWSEKFAAKRNASAETAIQSFEETEADAGI